MITLILSATLVAAIVLTIYPYVLYPLILRRLPAVPLAPRADGAPPRFALLLCAHNEERALPETLANLRRIKALWPQLSIRAYSDASTDRTAALLEEASDILTPVIATRRTGKPAGMRELVARSDAEVLIFMDANVLIDPGTVRRFEDYFSRPDVGAVACTLHYVNAHEGVAAQVGGLYWRLEEHIKQLETRTGSTMGADGALFGVRRDLYPAVRADLQDDFLASMQAVFAGLRCISAPDIVAFERGATCSAAEFRRKRRIACGAFSTHRAMMPDLRRMSPRDRFKYFSHKVIRWFGAFFIALGAASAALLAAHLGLLLEAATAAAASALAGALLLALRVGPVMTLWEILAAVVATAVGVVESARGARYVTWQPVER